MNEYSVAAPHELVTSEPVARKARGQSGADSFVIVVGASATPFTVVKAISGFEACKLHQVAQVENGRRHYRLRLGFFATYAQADAAVARIRKHYPAAFIERSCAQDKQNTGCTVTGKPAASRTLQPSTTSLRAAMPESAAPDNVVLLADSTQTVRALTQLEIDDPNQPKWYVVQLAVSDRQVNLDAMPSLEIFAAHRLYSISRQQSIPQHALRLGFFSEERFAEMVCEQLKTFYASASVVRISAAEQVRFAGSRPRVQSQNSAPPGAKVDQLRSMRDPGMKPVAPATFVKPTDAALASGTHRDADANGAASIAKAVISPARPVVVHPVAQQVAPVVGRSVQLPKPAAAGSAQQRVKKPKSLREELLEDARRIQMSKTGGHRISKPPGSWFSRLVGRSKS